MLQHQQLGIFAHLTPARTIRQPSRQRASR
jgi:hypothetical protein